MANRQGSRPTRTPLRRNRRAELNVIDFTLAKRALLRDAQVGVLGMTDICDAHPELMRAAKHVGEPTRHDCPVCGKAKLVLLAYVYGEGLRDQNGRVWSIDTGLRMTAAHPGSSCYVVEVCTYCQWNHLREAFTARHSATG
ncbi:MAG: DUF5318 family protein [Actinomycetota bacterium]